MNNTNLFCPYILRITCKYVLPLTVLGGGGGGGGGWEDPPPPPRHFRRLRRNRLEF